MTALLTGSSSQLRTEVGTSGGPRLAVVISCYNYERFVGHAIRSVLDQGRQDCELVVVDDGSTDGSWDVINGSGATAFKVGNGGQVAACLYGLDQTRAPFVLFLDADDELKPGSIGAIIDRLDPDVAKLQFSLARIDADGNKIATEHAPLKSFRSRDALARRVLRTGVYRTPPTSGNVFRRDLCELLRDAHYEDSVDGIILFAAPLLGDVVSISEELGCYRVHGRNKSGFGRTPDVRSLEHDIVRFVARTEHLRAVVRQLGLSQKLVDPHETFYFLERKFCLDIASGCRPRLKTLPVLLSKLMREPFSAKNKIAMIAFFILASALPLNRGKALISYRLVSGNRSAYGFAKEIVGW